MPAILPMPMLARVYEYAPVLFSFRACVCTLARKTLYNLRILTGYQPSEIMVSSK